jgi:hypothetical protein
MDWTDRRTSEQALWKAAIESGLGLLAAYITPAQYSLASVRLSARGGTEEDLFLAEIQSRIELGKALVLSQLVQKAEAALVPRFRHSVHYGEGRLEGSLLVPRLISERARNRFGTIPVLRTKRDVETPEALLISEAVRLAARVCGYWRNRGGAEGELAKELIQLFAQIETRPPWAELKLRTRPSIRNLTGIVKSRTIAGWNKRGSAIDQLTDLLLSDAEALLAAAGSIAYLVSTDPRFEDRLFELICLGWLIGGLQAGLDRFEVHEQNFRSGSSPLLTGIAGKMTVKVYYQAHHLPGKFSYFWKTSKKVLRAIPDFVVETNENGIKRNLIIDAKNRTRASSSEIIYKLLGYKENLAIEPYWAMGIAPTFAKPEVASVVRGLNKVGVAFVPLSNGRHVVRRAISYILRG